MKLLVSNSETGFFCPGKGIRGLRGGVQEYAAQTILQIDTVRAKRTFRMETNYGLLLSQPTFFFIKKYRKEIIYLILNSIKLSDNL